MLNLSNRNLEALRGPLKALETRPEKAVQLLRILRDQPEPLFAILDAARDPKVLEILKHSPEKYQSLYEGSKATELAPYAPYLVRLPVDSSLLETLVDEGWGKAWGIYFTCNESFDVVRNHLCHFVLVRGEDGRPLYFRFYDPRVLRHAIPLMNPEEATAFFGPVSGYLMESELPSHLVRYTTTDGGVMRSEASLEDQTEPANPLLPAAQTPAQAGPSQD